jgi:hypothetical protein
MYHAQAPHWRVCCYTETRRLLLGARQLAGYDIVLTTHNLMLWDSPLKTERALHQCACNPPGSRSCC